MKKTLFLAAAVVCAAFLLVSCNDTTGNNSNATGNNNNAASSGNNNNASKPADSKPADSKPADTVGGGGEVGVAECDAFLKKYEACINSKVPEAQRAAYKPGLDAWRKSWKDLAANPQTKPSLKLACEKAEEQSKASMTAFGCSW